jgi:hypothetical protein
MRSSILTSALLAALCGASPALAQETVDTRIGKLTFESGYPSQETVQKLYDEMDFQRASQAYLWGIPAVGVNEWRKAQTDLFKSQNGQMVSFVDFDEKLGILTPNFTTPYIVGVIDVEESGPIVLELPPGLMAGMIIDVWQRVLADLGVVGPDKGKGGKFLILPPGQEGAAPEGYYVVQSPSRIAFAAVRLLDPDREKAIAELVPGIKTYTWSAEGTGEVMPVHPAGDVKWSQMPPHGMPYWESLNEVVQLEPVAERDRMILAQLRFLGIEKGKPFEPDERQKKILEEAAAVGEAMAKANTSDKRVEPPFWEGTNWKHALVVSTDQRMPGFDQLDERAAWFYEAVAISKAMLTETPGRRAALHRRLQGRRRRMAERRQHLPAACPAQPTGRAVLVGHRLRRGHAPDGGHQAGATRHLLAQGGHRSERGRLNRCLLRPRGARRQGGELGPDQPRRGVVRVLPFLWSDRAVLRQVLGAARLREAELKNAARMRGATYGASRISPRNERLFP